MVFLHLYLESSGSVGLSANYERLSHDLNFEMMACVQVFYAVLTLFCPLSVFFRDDVRE